MIRRNARQWQDVLAGPGDTAHRLSPGIWSALEYACHVRDILRLYDERLVLMLTTGGPRYPNWDQDATAVAGRYASRILPGWQLNWATPLASSRRGSGRCPGIDSSGPASAVTGHGSRSSPSRGTSSTISFHHLRGGHRRVRHCWLRRAV